MNKRVLLLGSTGKMGVALKEVFNSGYNVIGKNSKDFDAANLEEVGRLIEADSPDIVINAVAFLGIDPCEKEPQKAFMVNTVYPKFLAELSKKRGFILVHFSTDAVFNGEKRDFYIESDRPCPLNLYGFTKYGGDCFVQMSAENYYIFRISILFGKTSKNTQFVEKMLQKAKEGHKVLRISDDIISSPTYSYDVAREVKRILEAGYPSGLYHIANEGKASLYDLMKEIIENLDLDIRVEKASYRDFPFLGIKNTFTPIKSEKIDSLRPWKEAVKEYCARVRSKQGGIESMADKYIMDGNKLCWHLDRVNDWLRGKRIVPIHIDVGLSKGCNIRCEYCFGVIQGNFYKKGSEVYFPGEPLLRYVREAGQMGVRSMGFIGEAEPLLNPYVYEAIVEGKKAGIDISMGTNGILLDTGKKGREALECLTWIRFNISAASDEGYRRIHGSKEFPTVIEKIKFCVETKRKRALNVTVGLQMVLTPSNVDQVVGLAKLGKELGVDYLVIKQCSDTVESHLGFFHKFDEYDNFYNILKEAEAQSSGDYNVIVKWKKITDKGRRNYDSCLGVPFLLYSSGDGKLYPCGMFFDIQEEEYRMGDLVKQSFREIWESDRYWDVVEKVKKIDVHRCYSGCRTDSINEFLWQLTHPPEHVNFI